MVDGDEMTREALRVADLCKPALHKRHPVVQGAALAELVALWLAGHEERVREQVLEAHIGVVRELTKVNAARLWGSRETRQ